MGEPKRPTATRLISESRDMTQRAFWWSQLDFSE
ncbi:Uncharacterised protein [Vibrio cholerae]|nr:Uncharacterised protein [Vibrio cholerae]CSI32762.1 Uncharacterised protein [Vibrio cholerae]